MLHQSLPTISSSIVVLQGVSVHQVAVSRGLPDMGMSFTPRGSNGKRQNSIEEDVEIANYLAPGDIEPMYSSFSCDNVFQEPVYLKPAAYALPLHVIRTSTPPPPSSSSITRSVPVVMFDVNRPSCSKPAKRLCERHRRRMRMCHYMWYDTAGNSCRQLLA